MNKTQFRMPDHITDDDGAFTLQEFCHRYGISNSAAYVEICQKRLEAKKRGRRTIIPRSSARAWFEALPVMVGKNSESQAA